MTALLRLTKTEIKLFFREVQSILWTFLFPILMLYIFGAIFKNSTVMGMSFADAFVPTLIGINLTSTAFFTLGIILTMYRERQILRRYHASPLHPAAVLGAQMLLGMLVVLLSGGVVLAAAKLFFAVHIPTGLALANFLGALIISMISFFTFGLALSGLAPNSRSAQPLAALCTNVMFFLSGTLIPYDILPKTLQYVAKAMPLYYVVNLLQNTWKGETIAAHVTDVYALIVVFVVVGAVAAKAFRWE